MGPKPVPAAAVWGLQEVARLRHAEEPRASCRAGQLRATRRLTPTRAGSAGRRGGAHKDLAHAGDGCAAVGTTRRNDGCMPSDGGLLEIRAKSTITMCEQAGVQQHFQSPRLPRSPLQQHGQPQQAHRSAACPLSRCPLRQRHLPDRGRKAHRPAMQLGAHRPTRPTGSVESSGQATSPCHTPSIASFRLGIQPSASAPPAQNDAKLHVLLLPAARRRHPSVWPKLRDSFRRRPPWPAACQAFANLAESVPRLPPASRPACRQG